MRAVNGPRVLRGVVILVSLLLGLALGGSASAKSRTLTMVPLVEHWNGSTWTELQIARPGGQLDQLDTVVAPSATSVWAFGWTRFAQRWDGTAWQRVALPVPKGSQSPEFHAAAAVSPNNIWAVGDVELPGSTPPAHAVIDHWNGHHWRMVRSSAPAGYSQLLGVTALSAKDVWAVGTAAGGTLTIHWNGKTWKRIASPNPTTPSTPARSSGGTLNAVAGHSSHDVWAVGQHYVVDADGNHALHPLVLHWNGRRWKAVSSPDPSGPAHRSFFYGVAAPSATGVWAVGSAARNGVQHALAERWDGTRWRIVPAHGNPLGGVSALTANDVWAAGGETGGSVTHWNGSAWTLQTRLDYNDALGAVVEVSPTNVWAVGVRLVSS